MFNQSKEEKEFYQKKQNPITVELSDRQLQEKQIYLLERIEISNERIKKNVVFFYYAFAVSLLLGIIILANG